MTGQDILTNSSEQTFLACPRLYYWTYEMGWRPSRIAAPLRMGSAGHLGIDALAKGAIGGALAAVETFYDGLILESASWTNPDQAQHDLAMECVTVQCLVAGYAQAYAESAVQILESESTFDLPIINPDTGAASRTFRQAGKRDRVARLPDGRIALFETKFVAADLSDESDYWRILGINQQLSKYILAARAQGLEVQTAVQDAIRKPTIKPNDQPEVDQHGIVVVRDANGERVRKKNNEFRLTADEAKGYTIRKRWMTPGEWRKRLSADIAAQPDRYYARREIPRLDSDLAEYATELWQIADRIRQCRNASTWFRNSGSCKRFNTLCPYYPLCAKEISVTEGTPAGFVQIEDVHPELTEPADEAAE